LRSVIIREQDDLGLYRNAVRILKLDLDFPHAFGLGGLPYIIETFPRVDLVTFPYVFVQAVSGTDRAGQSYYELGTLSCETSRTIKTRVFSPSQLEQSTVWDIRYVIDIDYGMDWQNETVEWQNTEFETNLLSSTSSLQAVRLEMLGVQLHVELDIITEFLRLRREAGASCPPTILLDCVSYDADSFTTFLDLTNKSDTRNVRLDTGHDGIGNTFEQLVIGTAWNRCSFDILEIAVSTSRFPDRNLLDHLLTSESYRRSGRSLKSLSVRFALHDRTQLVGLWTQPGRLRLAAHAPVGTGDAIHRRSGLHVFTQHHTL
jgi:hypothetical protein